jgi:predicted alpha/beta-hydrolase family hydrolase
MEPTPDPSQRLVIQVHDGQSVSALSLVPEQPAACLVLAHGAGAGMTHPSMAGIAIGLHHRGVATLRYQFPYMENGSRRPDRPTVAQQTVRAAVAEAGRHLPGCPLFAGGKSFGGRMTSLAQAASALPGVRGLVFFGFPLHPAGKPSMDRAAHLAAVDIPLLFLQGTRDALADQGLITELVAALGDRARLFELPDADHSFHVRARSGQTDTAVRGAMLDATAHWIAALCGLGSYQSAG